MKIRCISCTQSFAVPCGGSFDYLKCCHCGARHNIRARRDVLAEPESHLQAIRQLAEARDIDEPTANAVLLGLLTLHHGLELSARVTSANAQRGEPRAKRKRPLESGKRESESTVRILSRRDVDSQKTRSRTPVVLMLVGMLTVAASFGLYARRSWNREVTRTPAIGQQPQDRQEAPAATLADYASEQQADPRLRFVKLQWNHRDQLTRVTAPTPEAALVAFCDNYEQAAYCTPMELVTIDPPQIGVRLGLFRDLSQADTLRVVRIERDRVIRKWVAGNGRRPIDHFAADPNMMGSERVAVEPYGR